MYIFCFIYWKFNIRLTYLNCFILLLLKVDGDTSTNDCVLALASGLSGSNLISSLKSNEAFQLQACLDAVRYTIYYFL